MKRITILIMSFMLFIAIGGDNYSYAHNPESENSRDRENIIKSPAPKKGVKKLPPNAIEVVYPEGSYYQYGQKTYIKVGNGYVEIMPPAGLKVTSLGDGYKTFEYKNKEYYSQRGIVYIKATNGEYEVVMPTMGMILPELPYIDVTTLKIDDKIVYKWDGFYYEKKGNQYEVIDEH